MFFGVFLKSKLSLSKFWFILVIKFELNNNPQVFDLSLLKEMFFNGQGDLFDILVDSLGVIGVKFNNTFSGL